MEGFIDMRSAEDLLAFFLKQNEALQIPDQKHEQGLPPQPGVSCPKCTYRDLAGESYGIDHDPFGQSFLVSKETCDSLIRQSKQQPHRIDPAILNTLIHQNEFEEEHVAHVAAVNIPGIVAFFAFQGPTGPSVLCFLIDGTHRAVAAFRAGRDFLAYVLVPGDTIKCISRLNGKPNPHFIGGPAGNVLFDGRTAHIIKPGT